MINKEINIYAKKLMKLKGGEKFFNREEHVLLKRMVRNIFDSGRKELGYEFQEFINDNYKRVLISDIISDIYFNEKVYDFAKIAKKLSFYGNREGINGGKQTNGTLCRRYMELLVKDGYVTKSNNGTYNKN